MRACPALCLVPLTLLAGLAGCQSLPDPGAEAEVSIRPDQAFQAFAESWILEALDRSPETSIFSGRYQSARQVSLPDAATRAEDLAFIDSSLARLSAFDPTSLSASEAIDYELIRRRLEAQRWYLTEFRSWAWNPASHNIAGPISLILGTPFAPEEERLSIVSDRLARAPDFYRAARQSLESPTLEHIELAIVQSRGTLALLGDSLSDRVRSSALEADSQALFFTRLEAARTAIEAWIDDLEQMQQSLAAFGGARDFRIGAGLYEQKFAHDIQSGFSAAELYERALAEKGRLHAMMDDIAVALWPAHFPDQPMPDNRLQRIGRLIEKLSRRHVAREEFIDEIRRQIPLLEAFVRERDLLDQDPSRPLVVRETPLYMRGGGAGASVSAPGPFNPTAETFYNVTPLDQYTDEEAASYLREYNHWVLQILNIHEAIPGHYTQLLHANKSASLIKSLLRNGAMIEGWAVYAERMMLEEGWGEQAPELWLMYGKWNLRVVTNAILDYAVHVLGMEQQAAMDLLVGEAFQEQTEAANKWRRVKLSQVQLTSYFAGYAEIYDFRERRKAAQGASFDLKRFHNDFLSFGNAPVPAIIALMEDA